MAWRIDENVIRGEIDNRTPGRVVGRVWLQGRAAPLELDLAGNAWRDLAGRRLEFVNPAPVSSPDGNDGLVPRQTGVIGDCTASRKVRVPEIPLNQIGEYYAAKKPFPWHWGNSLYLEWFSTANGRVVIESASYELKVDPEFAWEMTEAEEEAQRRANAEAMGSFMGRLGEAVAPPEADVEPPAGDSSHRPPTEAEAEKMQEESDLLADRINARVDREGIENFEKILEEELARRREQRGEPPLTPEQEAERLEWLNELSRAAEENLANPDPETEAELARRHPLSERAFVLAGRLVLEPEERGWIPPDAGEEHGLVDLVSSVTQAAAKLAGALDGFAWPPPREFCASSIVRLKRARSSRSRTARGRVLRQAVSRDRRRVAGHSAARAQRARSRMRHDDWRAARKARARLRLGARRPRRFRD
jgi:hypothetical protein